ncbi:aldo/keto reductase [Azospirillum sp. sgz302134]
MKTLTHHGTHMPALGLGTWQLTGSVCARVVRGALDLGYRHIDTAQAYGNEAEVGAAIAEAGITRSQLFLTTKLWMDRLTRGEVERSTEESLRRLRTDYVDLLLIHWPNPRVPLEETLGAMTELCTTGKVRRIGVSNFPVALLRQAVEEIGADIFCDQVEYHPLLSQAPVLDYLRPRGMLLVAYSPLAHGEVLTNPEIRRIADKMGATPAQVSLAWLLGQDNVAVIPKATSVEHLRANLAALDLQLDPADRAALDKLAGHTRTIAPSWAPNWDT